MWFYTPVDKSRSYNADIKQKLFLAKSTSGQEEANNLFWLATRESEMIGISRIGPARKSINLFAI